jgi:hypothetical protein
MVQVPVIRVEREAREIAVPYIDIDVPGAGEAGSRQCTG